MGVVVPDEPEFHNAAFSRAGQMFQQNLLLALKHAGLTPSIVLSVRPIPSFPRSRRILIGGGVTYLPEETCVHLLPFFNITPLKQITIGLSVLWSLLRWGWRTRCTPYRVVYTYNLSVPPGLFTLLGARLIGAKALVSLNDINVPGQTASATPACRLDFWLHRVLIPRFDGLVVVTKRIVDDFAPGKSYICVEGGVEKKILDQTDEARRTKKPPATPFTLVFAGSLREINGVLVLLEAFSLLAGQHYRLRIAGGGSLAQKVREAAAKDPRIEYRGFLSFDEVLTLYTTADVLLNIRLTKMLNTRYFFPSKLMEYLASGTPVITTCTGHVEEEFADIAYLLKDESPQGLAEIIRAVASLDPQVRMEMGRKARAYMVANKSWDTQGRKVVRFIRSQLLSKE